MNFSKDRTIKLLTNFYNVMNIKFARKDSLINHEINTDVHVTKKDKDNWNSMSSPDMNNYISEKENNKLEIIDDKLYVVDDSEETTEKFNSLERKIGRVNDGASFKLLTDYDGLNGITKNKLSYCFDALHSNLYDHDESSLSNLIDSENSFINNNGLLSRKGISLADSAYLSTSTSNLTFPFTVEFFIDRLTSYSMMFDDYSTGIVLGVYNGTLMCSGSSSPTASASKLLDSKPHLITVTYESKTSFKVYYDGELISLTGSNNYLTCSAHDGLLIGKRKYSDANKFTGIIHRFRLYERILSQEEIEQNYKSDLEMLNLNYDEITKLQLNLVQHVNENKGIEDTPVGHIMSVIGTSTPKHYLPCDGSIYNIIDYPDLSEYIKSQYGLYNFYGGDGVTTFGVPNKDTSDDMISCIKYEPTYYVNINNSIVTQDVEIGTIISKVGTTTPIDYLPCDGNIYNIEDYKELAEYLKEQFGSYNFYGGDGVTTFAVPEQNSNSEICNYIKYTTTSNLSNTKKQRVLFSGKFNAVDTKTSLSDSLLKYDEIIINTAAHPSSSSTDAKSTKMSMVIKVSDIEFNTNMGVENCYGLRADYNSTTGYVIYFGFVDDCTMYLKNIESIWTDTDEQVYQPHIYSITGIKY